MLKAWRTRLRSEFSTKKKQRGSDKLTANERSAESRIETAMGVESRAVRSSSSRGVSSHSATGSIEIAFFTSANSTNLSVAIADLIFEDALPTSLVDSPRLKRVIELSKLVPLSYRIPDRKASSVGLRTQHFPEQFATPSPSILAQFASARVPFQAPSIFTRQFKHKHWTKRFPSSSPRSHSANIPNRCRDASSLLGEIITAQKNAASTFYVISINTANFDDTIYYRNSQPRAKGPKGRN